MPGPEPMTEPGECSGLIGPAEILRASPGLKVSACVLKSGSGGTHRTTVGTKQAKHKSPLPGGNLHPVPGARAAVNTPSF